MIGLTETSWALGLLVGVTTMGLVTAATNWRVGYVRRRRRRGRDGGVVAAPDPAARTTAHATPRRAPRTRPRSHRRGMVVVGGSFCLMAASQSLFVTFGSWLEDSFGFSRPRSSAVVFASGSASCASSITSARCSDRWGKERSAALGAGLMIPERTGAGALAPASGLGLVLLVVAVVGFEFAIVSALALASRLVPGSPARGLGMMIGAGTLGRASGLHSGDAPVRAQRHSVGPLP